MATRARSHDVDAPVIVVGAGIAGVACARRVAGAGLRVVVYDRGRRIGGRMAVRTIGQRAVDVGASYLTVRDAGFEQIVESWHARGLARPWTDTFHVGGPEGLRDTTSGPLRWAAPAGLRSLVEDLAAGFEVRRAGVTRVGPGPRADGHDASAVVLAMPDPQALRLLGDRYGVERGALQHLWEPSLALSAGWQVRCWPELDGVFVSEHPTLTWIADDGRRRGDGAPVLVAHTTADFAREHLADPGGAEQLILAGVQRVLGPLEPPVWTHVQRWTYAHPSTPRPEPFFLSHNGIGVCGDGWANHARVEAAFLSGDALGAELVRRLSPKAG